MHRLVSGFAIVVSVTLLAQQHASAAVYPGRGITASTGNQRGLYLVLRPDTAPPLNQAKIDAIRASETLTREFFAKSSGGKLDLRYADIVDVPITLAVNPQDNQLHRPNDWWGIAENYVRSNFGLEPEAYQLNLFDVSATPEDVNQGWSGVATFPGNNLAMQTPPGPGWGQLVVDHELGHRTGAPHSSAWRLSDNGNFNPHVWDAQKKAYVEYSPTIHGLSPVAYGVELDEYGDPLSVMGNISNGTFSVHQKRVNMGWLSSGQVPDLNATGDGTYRVYAHDQLQSTLNAQANVMGVVNGYDANSRYGLTFNRNDQVFNKGVNAFQTRTDAFTLEYRAQEEGVFVYLNDGLLDLDLTGGSDRNDRRRSLQVGDRFEDIAVSPSYFVGTGAANEWAAIGAPPPTSIYQLRPSWFEFDVLAKGQDLIGSYVDVDVSTVSYVPPGDLNNDGLFNQLDVNKFVAHWRSDTSSLNRVGQWMAGDLDNSGLVDLDDASLLRTILIYSTGQSFGLTTSVPETPASMLSVIAILAVVLTQARSPLAKASITSR
ncbi:hypothetical protein [Lacipirellula parvula]|uniref:Dockerin domain-containing protein n=1 Tax=Lacipirellula parvula TaxID=2650471 RepID=A0A5K7X6U6_9BACT|nr:hypothetical protein [Lacipirellula parvula]BBO30451.1 hypothetical protein PLANPX_0063 [Lacipirellula parvula]